MLAASHLHVVNLESEEQKPPAGRLVSHSFPPLPNNTQSEPRKQNPEPGKVLKAWRKAGFISYLFCPMPGMINN